MDVCFEMPIFVLIYNSNPEGNLILILARHDDRDTNNFASNFVLYFIFSGAFGQLSFFHPEIDDFMHKIGVCLGRNKSSESFWL